MVIIRALVVLALFAGPALAEDAAPAAPERESVCDDGKDNDGDTVLDCGDIDCAAAPNCQPDGQPESTDARCSDWVDNDGDGAIDCDDSDCEVDHLNACKGSWKGPMGGDTPVVQGAPADAPEVLPLGEGMTVDDLIGKGADKDGERNDYLCADGIDNDGDGATDCADFGCRFDLSVSVCRGNPGLRFSVVGMVAHTYDLEADTDNGELANDTRFSRLQLRTFGPIPGIQDSFFLVSMLAQRSPRVTFAMFQVPIANSRHRIAVNSGAAGLAQINAISAHKQLFIDRPDLFRAMEQFNSAAVEVAGPITDDGRLQYRLFGAGGSGRFDGNIGGRTVSGGDLNYPWSVGGSVQLNAVGYYSRFDTPFLYVPVPLAVAVIIGAKYDEREQERYASVNAHLAIRYGRFIVMLEDYFKREFEFESDTNAVLGQAGFLLWPKHLMVAAQAGMVRAGEFENLPTDFSGSVGDQRDEDLWGLAAHWYVYRNIGVLSAVFRDHRLPEQDGDDEIILRREFKLVGQYRF